MKLETILQQKAAQIIQNRKKWQWQHNTMHATEGPQMTCEPALGRHCLCVLGVVPSRFNTRTLQSNSRYISSENSMGFALGMV